MSISRIFAAKEQALNAAHAWREEPFGGFGATSPPSAVTGTLMVTIPANEWAILVLAIDDAWKASNQESEPK